MELYFTRHARNRLRLYEVKPAEVEEALKHPQQVTEAAFEARHAWKQRACGEWLRVTFKDEGARRVIVTVTPKRIGPGGSHAH